MLKNTCAKSDELMTSVEHSVDTFGVRVPRMRAIDHGWLRMASAEDEIARFAQEYVGQTTNDEPSVTTAPFPSPSIVLELLEQAAPLDDDLRHATHAYLTEQMPNSSAYAGFCRYALEGARHSYAARGINLDVLRRLLRTAEFRGMNGVDLGIGNGEILQSLTQAGACITGFDLSPCFVQGARARGLIARMARVDVDPAHMETAFRLPSGSQDFVISTMVLDRVERPWDYLHNMLGLLKRGGRFALQTILPVSPVDDGGQAEPITYTPAANRIVPGRDIDEDKRCLVQILHALGGTDIDIVRLPYAIASRDGLQYYTVWSFAGYKGPSGHKLDLSPRC